QAVLAKLGRIHLSAGPRYSPYSVRAAGRARVPRDAGPCSASYSLRVDDDAAAGGRLRIRGVDVVGSADVVVDGDAAGEVPDLDPELVHTPAAGQVAVGRR